MKIYVSGPMRGYKKFNFPLFDKVSGQLEATGITVYNPAKHDRQVYPDIEQWEGFESGDTAKCPKFILPDSLKWDFASILAVDAIVLLPGWEKSSGAKAERFVAESIGKKVFIYLPSENSDEAFGLVLDDRNRMQYPALEQFDPNTALVFRKDIF